MKYQDFHVYTDEDGNWGIEDDNWCIINDSRSASNSTNECDKFENLGYSYCLNQNIQIEYTDDTGNWGL